MRLSHRGRLVLNSVLALATVGVALVVVLGWKSATRPFQPAACQATAAGSTFQVSPEQMANAATIAGIAVKRHLPARAATIALATARQESKFINVDYGDRDSLGLFQQRPSQGWGTPAQVRDPVHATNAFYDALVKVHGYQSMEITKVAQKVQRSAYPEAYADHEPEGRVLASALTGHSTAALTCRLGDGFRPGGATGLKRYEQALPHEQAPVRVSRIAGVTGVRLAVTDPTLAWSLAQWSVGSAERFGVTRVYVDGRVWDHRRPDDGWRASPEGGRGVVVLFTDADLPRP
ncbi:hypothetical protein [Angustibacter sp. Root456]|uniref:hypothetical protein n=1 Tax=Angustibacter sp. Root456 TaxID=1736539 RepID=UPI0009E8E441|nr:hypothetical protein [Angustibacter sp. Root456]